MREKIDLTQAKESLGLDNVFLSAGDTRFTIPEYGKYKPGMVMEISASFMKGGNEHAYHSDYHYEEFKKFTDGMNMNFDGTPEVLFGNFRRSQAGKPVFSITDPTRSKHVLIRVNWGGAFNSSRGRREDSEEAKSALYFKRCASNGGGAGYDYYVLTVGHVLGHEERDVKEFLETMSGRIAEREKEYDDRRKAAQNREEEQARQKRVYKDRIIQKIEELQETARQSILPQNEGLFRMINYAEYKDDYVKLGYDRPYDKQTYDELEKAGAEISNYEAKYKRYKQDIQEYINILKAYDVEVSPEKNVHKPSGLNYVITAPNMMEKHIDIMVNGIEQLADETKIITEILTERQKQRYAEMLKLKEQAENQKLDREGLEAGCPTNFAYYRRTTGMSGNSRAFVIQKNGRIRPNDDVELRNFQHQYSVEDWVHNAEGKQIWHQIRNGEAVIAYEKMNREAPLEFHTEWLPDHLTEAQKDTINELAQDLCEYYEESALEFEGLEITPEKCARVCENIIEDKRVSDMQYAIKNADSIENIVNAIKSTYGNSMSGSKDRGKEDFTIETYMNR